MKILFHNYHSSLNENNSLFQNHNTSIGDNLLSPFVKLSEQARDKGILVGTMSVLSVCEADAVVFVDYPLETDTIFIEALRLKKRLFLIVLESPAIRPENIDIYKHSVFEKVFTWSDEMISKNPDKYFKIFYSFNVPENLSFVLRKKMFVLISGNKTSNSPFELYFERYKCIKYFTKYFPQIFDLYGTGWDIYISHKNNLASKLFNKLNCRFLFWKQNLSVYKGPIARKHDFLKQYTFSICFENVYGYNGYVTEKIFDCLMAGTIPIYKGAPNVSQFVPNSCYIDYDRFDSLDRLVEFCYNMKDETKQEYLNNIQSYLNSEIVLNYSCESFANTIIHEIIN